MYKGPEDAEDCGSLFRKHVAAVITCFITNTATEWSVMQFRADRRPDGLEKGMERGRGYGDGRSWSVSC